MQEDASPHKPDQVAHHPAAAMRKPEKRQPPSPLPNRHYGFLIAALAFTCLVLASLIGCQSNATTNWGNDFAPLREISHLSHWQQQLANQGTNPTGTWSSRSLNQPSDNLQLATTSTNPKAWWYDRQNQNLISTGAYAAPSMRYEQSWTTTYDRMWATPNGVRDHYYQTRVQQRYEQTGQRR